MNRILRFITAGALLAIVSVALIGCASADGLTRFLLVAGQNVETADSLDDVDTADVSDDLVDELAFVISGEVMLLEEGTELTPAEKIAEIRRLRNEIRLTHEAIVASRETVRSSFQNLREDVATFRASGATLTEEQRARVIELTDEVKQINAALRDSIGNCYQRMHALRGRYNLQNVDEILAAHHDVLDILTARQAHLARIQVIFAELDLMVAVPEA
ncbi:MAG TPA: hypothetical protein DCR44_08120 [Acholeplasmatales bacterium]|nr:MAG: hypothetical protein A2Y16_04020 [Tenericutes bacterium GWF2_57_13]HAQ57334.1 hypothetical protein [Acholeplasmatales bacterium]